MRINLQMIDPDTWECTCDEYPDMVTYDSTAECAMAALWRRIDDKESFSLFDLVEVDDG